MHVSAPTMKLLSFVTITLVFFQLYSVEAQKVSLRLKMDTLMLKTLMLNKNWQKITPTISFLATSKNTQQKEIPLLVIPKDFQYRLGKILKLGLSIDQTPISLEGDLWARNNKYQSITRSGRTRIGLYGTFYLVRGVVSPFFWAKIVYTF